MHTFEQFDADVATAFAFLETDHGMKRSSHRSGAEVTVTYENALARVRIGYELGAGIDVTVEDPKYESRPLDTSRSYALSEFVPEEVWREAPSLTVAQLARIMQIHARGVLLGNFVPLHEKHDRLVAATVANRKQR